MRVHLTCSAVSKNNTFVSNAYVIERPGKVEMYIALADTILGFAKLHTIHPNTVSTSTVWHDTESV
jgi:hypothetical protein